MLPSDEYGAGHEHAEHVLAAERASAAMAATRAESMPPLRPSTADLKPHLCT